MEESDEIYSSDFSARRLSELLNLPYGYISQVINETYGSTFNSLLNKYRIKEVCRRMNTEEGYLSLTIEAIANGVGIRSRTTFVNAFKAHTGLTPSKYMRIAASNGR